MTKQTDKNNGKAARAEYMPPGTKPDAENDIAALFEAVSDLAEMMETSAVALSALCEIVEDEISDRSKRRELQKIGREADKLAEDARELQEDLEDE
jgi:gamma-glutamyl:cysteine ligase YbdK (ATP-grasp superfamily)